MNVAEFLARLQAEAGGAGRPIPPVETWNPERCGTMDVEIRADGTWAVEGSPIGREKLVRLFSTILRRDEDGSYWLVTPVEKVEVRVADAPFVAVRAERMGEGADQSVAFFTNVGDVVALGGDHPLRVEMSPRGEPRPYVRVRGGLEALILRAPFYDLVAWSEERDGAFGVWSGGVFWPL